MNGLIPINNDFLRCNFPRRFKILGTTIDRFSERHAERREASPEVQ
jgi:hypothetical protein